MVNQCFTKTIVAKNRLNQRFLRGFIFFVVILSARESGANEASPFDHEALGECHRTAELFALKVFGSTALSDLNIKRMQDGVWIWIVDDTASKNHSWYLLEGLKDEVCLRAYIPIASSVQKMNGGLSKGLRAIVSPELDYPAREVEFRRKPGSAFLSADRCFVFRNRASGAVERKRIPCDRMFE